MEPGCIRFIEEERLRSLERASGGSAFSVDDRLYRGTSVLAPMVADLKDEDRLCMQ